MNTKLLTIAALGLMMIPVTQATPMDGNIAVGSNYTVIHNGANPGGTGDRDEWGWFLPGQQIDVNLENGILTLDGSQTFAMSFAATESIANVTFLDMTLDLNDHDGFAGGFLEYTMDAVQFGIFDFYDLNYSSIFNTSSQTGNLLNVYAWGGDEENGLGIDLALSLVVVPVTEPAMVALLLLGLSAMTLMVTLRQKITVRR